MTTNELEPRTCANCACHAMQEDKSNPLQTQMFCRRDTPMAQQMRVQRPTIRDGKPVMMKADPTKPLMNDVTEIVFMYRPTLPGLVCFDGWRPFGTAPGRPMDSTDGMLSIMKRLHADLIAQSLENLPEEPTHMSLSVDGLIHDGPLSMCALCDIARETKGA
jgi:hypothetical protein